MREPAFDFEQDGSMFRIYADAPHNPKRMRKAIMHALAESEVAEAVVVPLPMGRWDRDEETYVFEDLDDDDEETPERPEPVVPLDQIGWAVSVYPRSVFDWTEARAEVVRRGRTILRETDHAIEVASRDEQDASQLIADLGAVPVIRRAEGERLGWFRRWQIREQFLGNYAGTSDPTQPLL